MSKHLFREVYEEYLEYAKRRHKEQGFNTLKQNFNKNILPYFEDRYIEDLEICDILNWQNAILDKKHSNNYNRNIYQAFKSFSKYCTMKQYFKNDIVNEIGPFKKNVENSYHNVYTKKEYKKFRKGLKNKIYRYFFDLLFYYGLRSGEAMGLKFSDLNGKFLNITHSINRGGNREIIPPKTKNSVRVLKLSISMRFKIFILKCLYDKKYGNIDFDYFVFGGKKPLSPTTLKRYKHNACIKMNINEITTHEFRHSYATRMLKKEKSIKKVADNLGHSSVAITYDFYIHNKKRDIKNISWKCDFFKKITQTIKKITKTIITHFVV